MTVKATDKDEGDNGKVTYHLRVDDANVQETDEFVIDAESGELRTKVYLDREVKSKYEVSQQNILFFLKFSNILKIAKVFTFQQFVI